VFSLFACDRASLWGQSFILSRLLILLSPTPRPPPMVRAAPRSIILIATPSFPEQGVLPLAGLDYHASEGISGFPYLGISSANSARSFFLNSDFPLPRIVSDFPVGSCDGPLRANIDIYFSSSVFGVSIVLKHFLPSQNIPPLFFQTRSFP